MFILGVTGPSGAGKTLASRRFLERGFGHIDADKLAREVVKPGSQCLSKLEEAFGGGIIRTDGSLDRKKLASLAFDGGKVELLNAITHPFILERLKTEIMVLSDKNVKYLILDAPTLFESGADRLCDKVMVVTAARELRIKRIMERDGISLKEATARVDAQPAEEFYTSRADFIISSDRGETQLFDGVDRVAEKIVR